MDAQTNTSQVLLLTVEDHEAILPLCFKICSDHDFTDAQCGVLVRNTKKLYEEEHGSRGEGNKKLHKQDQGELLSYSNYLKPEYLISVNKIYRAKGKLTSSPVVPKVREMAVLAASNMVGSLTAGSRGEFSASFNSDPTFTDCLMITVLDGSVKVRENAPEEQMWWRERRKSAVVRMISRLANEGRIDDTKFIFCPGDCLGANVRNLDNDFGYPLHYGLSTSQGHQRRAQAKGGEVAPFFSVITCDGARVAGLPVVIRRGDDVEFSQWDNFTVRELLINSAYKGRGGRVGKAVFRGVAHGKSCWDGDAGGGTEISKGNGDRCGRRKLMKVAAANQDVFDVLPGDYIPLQVQEKYTVSLVVEGHCGWSDRTKYLAFMDNVVVKQRSFCREWYEDGMVPWVHYVPVDYLLETMARNVREVLGWREEERERMVGNMQEFARGVLTQESMEEYVEVVVNEFTRAYWGATNNLKEEDEEEEEGVDGAKFLLLRKVFEKDSALENG